MPSPIKNYYESEPDIPFPGAGLGAKLITAAESSGLLQSERVVLKKNEEFPTHIHPKSNHILFITKGTGFLGWEEEGKKYSRDIKEGDHFIVEGGLIHNIGAYNKGMEFLVINIPPIPLEHDDYMKVHE